MANALLTLADLFLGGKQLIEEELSQLEQAVDTYGTKEQLADHKDASSWPAAWRHIQSEFPRLFDVSLVDILLASWKKYRLVSKYAEPDALPLGKRTILELGERNLSSTHKPYIELRANDQLIATLAFTIKLQLQFETLKLTVGDGRIWCIEIGDCKGTGSVLMREQTILIRDFGRVDLPGKIDFKEGIPIPTLNNPYRWGDGTQALASTTG